MLTCAAASLTTPTADVERLTLYQRTARSPLIVHGRSLSDSTRRPRIEVLKIYKGRYSGETLEVVPTYIDFTDPLPGVEREVFRAGDESILFLRPYVDEFGRPGESHQFAVVSAADGKVDLPPEGAGALVDAIVRFVEILQTSDHERQAIALRSLLRERNPLLVEAAIEECRRFRFVLPEDTATVLALLDHPRPDFRAGALALLGVLVQDFGSGPGAATAESARLFDAAAAAARFDPSADVRGEAVRVLEAFGTHAALMVIESIGRHDTEQSVRYRAQVAAYHLRKRLE